MMPIKLGQNLSDQALLLAKQLVINNLLACYRELTPPAIKIFLACIEQAQIEITKANNYQTFTKRPSIRNLAKFCNLSKATTQNGLHTLIEFGLLKEDRLVLRFSNNQTDTKFFYQSTNSQLLSSSEPLSANNQTTINNVISVENSVSNKLIINEVINEVINESVINSIAENANHIAINNIVENSITPLIESVESKITGTRRERIGDVDDELIERYQKGDKEAFAELYKRHFNNVLSTVRRFLPESTIHDVTQQIFIELMKKLQEYRLDGKAKFTTWLHKFTEFSLANARRKIRRDQQLTPLTTTHDIKAIIRLTSPQQQILPYILTLDEIQQECVYYHYYEGLTYEDIAEKLKLDKKVVRNYLQTARRHIRTMIDNKLDSKQVEVGEKQAEVGERRASRMKKPEENYNEFLQVALERERKFVDQNTGLFSLCLFSAQSNDDVSLELNKTLSSIIFKHIRQDIDQAFQLGKNQFALILRDCPANAGGALAKRLYKTLSEEVSIDIRFACSVGEYRVGIAWDIMLHNIYLKFIEAQKVGGAIFVT